MNRKLGTLIKGIALTLIALGMINAITYAQVRTRNTAIPMPVSINALMVTLIDHSAHYIWDYGFLSTERELTDDEWQIVEYYSVQLAASGPLITLGGTGSADSAWSENEDWIELSREMSDIALVALTAAREKDVGRLQSSGDRLVESCESCHNFFKPDVPTEGIVHDPQYDHLYHLLSPQGDN